MLRARKPFLMALRCALRCVRVSELLGDSAADGARPPGPGVGLHLRRAARQRPQGKGSILATKAVETQGKGGDLATKAVETQGKGRCLGREGGGTHTKGRGRCSHHLLEVDDVGHVPERELRLAQRVLAEGGGQGPLLVALVRPPPPGRWLLRVPGRRRACCPGPGSAQHQLGTRHPGVAC